VGEIRHERSIGPDILGYLEDKWKGVGAHYDSKASPPRIN